MNKTHEFYPMLTGTMKTIIKIAMEQFPNDSAEILNLLLSYPNISWIDANLAPQITKTAIDELDRQYARWNKGGNNGQ